MLCSCEWQNAHIQRSIARSPAIYGVGDGVGAVESVELGWLDVVGPLEPDGLG
jgi:hypothetical protein